MANFTLHKGAGTKNVTVARITMEYSDAVRIVRGQVKAWVAGWDLETVTPLRVTYKVLESTEDAAITEMKAIRDYDPDAIQRDETGDFRAILGLMAYQARPINKRLDSWLLELVYVPTFPRWTTTEANNRTTYDAATKV